MGYPFKNLVFEGGGIKGIGYVGALEYIENHDTDILPNITRFGGTSAGAITALILGLGYNVAELKEMLRKVQFEDFKDDTKGPLRDIFRLTTRGLRHKGGFGRYKGKVFMTWIKNDIINKKIDNWIENGIVGKEMANKNLTFEQLFRITGKEVYFQAANVSTRQVETFSPKTTPHMSLVEAVRFSMSIPFFFKSIVWRGHYYVDGGVLNNYPIRLFDNKSCVSNENHSEITPYYEKVNEFLRSVPRLERSNSLEDIQVYNKETLGFRLDSKVEIDVMRHLASPVSHNIYNLWDFTWNLIGTVIKGQESMHLHQDDSVRTIYIDSVDVSAIDFKISSQRQDDLIESGNKSAKDFFEKYDNPDNKNINKITRTE